MKFSTRIVDQKIRHYDSFLINLLLYYDYKSLHPGECIMTSVESLIEELVHARQVMRQLLADLEQTHGTSLELYPTWTIKELLSHLAGWDDACIATLQAVAVNKTPATPAARGLDLYNESTVAERADLPLEKIILEWEKTREIFHQAIRDFPPDKVDAKFTYAWGSTGNLTTMVKIFAEHELEHAEEIRKNLDLKET